MRGIVKNIAVFLLALIVIGSFFSLYSTKSIQKEEKVGIESLIQRLREGKIESILIYGESVRAKLKEEDKIIAARKEPGEPLSTMLRNYGIEPKNLEGVKIEVKDQTGLFMLNAFVTFVLPFLIIAFFIYIMVRQVQGANSRAMMFGSSRARRFDAKNQKERVTFNDFAGATESKEELHEIIDFLKDPKKFTDLGAKIPRGVLLVGSPGTGKTLLAKAVAGEAEVPFFHVSGSEFIEMFVGVGASRVRDLFAQAKKTAPSIVFIDEIDAVGRQRGAGLGGSHDEREQTLNQILVELDGFEPNASVIVIAATNRPDVLDPALLRPGRFDRRVMIDLPNIEDREAILKVHAANKPINENVSLRRVAERTPGFSGADLSNLLNEAAILVARENRKIIELDDILISIEKVLLGPERKSQMMSEKEKKITAYHEAGHAIISHVLPDAPPVQKVSIIARGQAGGYTLNMPTEDKHYKTKTEFASELAVLLGGYVAEQEIFGDVTTGASSDLKKATRLARKLITDYGMSEQLGQRTFGERDDLIFLGKELAEHRDYSEKSAELIDQEIARFLNAAHQRAREIIRSSREKMESIVTLLLEKETLEREAFEAAFGTPKEAAPQT